MRHEVKLQLSSDSEIEAIKRAIRSIEKSGKVTIHWIRTQEIGPVGRPNEVGAEIMAHLSELDYPRSAKQIGTSLKRSPQTLYRVLYALVAEDKLEVVMDERWKVKRFGDSHQVAKWKARDEMRKERARIAAEKPTMTDEELHEWAVKEGLES